MGGEHRREDAVGEDHAGLDRGRQTTARSAGGSHDRRQGPRGVESVFQLVHGAQPRGVEFGVPRQILQRRQFASAVSHRG